MLVVFDCCWVESVDVIDGVEKEIHNSWTVFMYACKGVIQGVTIFDDTEFNGVVKWMVLLF